MRRHLEKLEPRLLLAADVSVELRYLPERYFPERHHTYELRASNRGDEVANVRLAHATGLLDPKWKLIPSDAIPERPGLAGVGDLDTTLALAAGSELVFRIDGNVPDANGREIVSWATATLLDAAVDADPANNEVVHRAVIESQTRLELITASPSNAPTPGEEVSYSFSVTNEGTFAKNVTIHDPATQILQNVNWSRTTEAFSTHHYLGRELEPDPSQYVFREWRQDGMTLSGDNGFVIEGRLPIPQFTDSPVRFDSIGRSVSTNGDLNHDGVHDIVVGQRGEVFVKFGSADNIGSRLRPEELTGTTGLIVTGFENNDWSAQAETIGDVNSDGFDDLLIGTQPSNAGDYEFYIVFGQRDFDTHEIRANSLVGQNGFRIVGLPPVPRNGSWRDQIRLAAGGDLNGDGIPDFVIATPFTVVGVFGAAALGAGGVVDAQQLSGDDGFVLDRQPGRFGVASDVAIGDLDADGNDDLAVVQEGEVFVFFGRSDPWPSRLEIQADTTLKLTGIVAGRLDSGGDVNADGIDDLIVADQPGGLSSVSNSAFLLAGSRELSALKEIDLSVDFALRIDGTGLDVARMLGDINGDGVDDLAVGTWSETHVVFGSDQQNAVRSVDVTSLSPGSGFTWHPASRPVGLAISGSTDVNGDGIDDLVISFDVSEQVYRGARRYADGETHVIFGRPSRTVSGSGEIHEVTSMAEFQTITYNVTGTVPDEHQGILKPSVSAYLPADISVTANNFPELVSQSEHIQLDFAIGNRSEVDAYDVAIRSLVEEITDVQWQREIGFPAVRELYQLDSDQSQPILADEALPATHILAWDYDGDGQEDDIAANLDGILDLAGVDPFVRKRASSASLGDIDGDGFDDLLFVGVEVMSDTRPILIVFGSSQPISLADVFEVKLQGSYRRATAIGDFNGDGFNDFALSAPLFEGRVTVVFGGDDIRSRLTSQLTVDGFNGFELVGTTASRPYTDAPHWSGDKVGFGLSSVGDFNQDGVDDLLVSSTPYCTSIPCSRPGTFIVLGRQTRDYGTGRIDHVLDIPPKAVVNYTVSGAIADNAETMQLDVSALPLPRQTDPDLLNNAFTKTIDVTKFSDLNRDGQTNLADFLILQANFGNSDSPTREQGDVDDDDSVTFLDFLLFADRFLG